MKREKNLCAICGIETLFFNWSTSRTVDSDLCQKKFDIPKFLHIEYNNKKYDVPNGVPICFKCIKENKLDGSKND